MASPPTASLLARQSPVGRPLSLRAGPRCRAFGLLRTSPLAVLIAILAGGAVAGTLVTAGRGGFAARRSLAYGPAGSRRGRLEAFLTGALLAPSPGLPWRWCC